MEWKDKKRFGYRRLLRSFKYAFSGLIYVVLNEQNIRIHLIISVVVLLLAYLLQIPTIHWLIVLIVIGIVLALEIMNTAIERTIDLITEEYHPLAKVAKDVAAASVLVFSIFAAIIGLIIFLPPLIKFVLGGKI